MMRIWLPSTAPSMRRILFNDPNSKAICFIMAKIDFQ